MDHYTLTNGPTSLDIGSYLLADPGPDFDFGSLFQAQYVENAVAEGGILAYEHSGVRRFKFPLRLASSGAFTGGLNGLETLLRTLARPGAIVDILPDSTPSSEAVRFDVLGGRVDDTYSLPIQRLSRRSVTLELDVKPFGYWPTTILLASAGLASPPFQMTWNPASIIGDAPAQALIQIRANIGTVGALASTNDPFVRIDLDGLWWSLSRASGATIMLSPSQFVAATQYNNSFSATQFLLSAAVASDGFAPLGVSFQTRWNPSVGRWFPIAQWAPASADDNLYRGRFRVFAYMRTSPSWGTPVQVSVDEAIGGANAYPFLASAYPVGTLIPQANASFTDVASNAILGPIGAASGVFQILDMGEHTFPPIASGLPAGWGLRVWGNFGSTAPGVASPMLEIGGIYLLPAENAGIIPRGLIAPTQFNIVATAGGNVGISDTRYSHVTLDAANQRIVAMSWIVPALDAGLVPLDDLRRVHYGALPYLSPSTTSLDIGMAGRRRVVGATNAMFHAPQEALSASVSYRPRFVFLKGL